MRNRNPIVFWFVAGALALNGAAARSEEDLARIPWIETYETGIEQAASQSRPVLVTVSAVWCGACRQMQQLTFSDPRVVRAAQEGFIPVKIDADRRPDLVSKLKIDAFPTTLLLSPEGQVLRRWVGFQAASDFAGQLEQLRGDRGRAADGFAPLSALYPFNAIPYAFGGYCLVTLLEENRLVRGDAQVLGEHQGQTVAFASEEHRAKFLQDPEKYWPVANGKCLVTSREEMHDEPGDPRVGVRWRGKLWFFADRERQQRFIRAPKRFADEQL